MTSSGSPRKAIRKPTMIGCRTTRYSHGVWNAIGVGAFSELQVNLPEPEQIEVVDQNVEISTINQPSPNRDQ